MDDLLDDLEVPIADQVAEAERELAMRIHVYHRAVSRRTMTEAQAARRIKLQRAIVCTLRSML